jgi:hypothetical protein
METKKNSRTFVIGVAAGVLVALALGGAFLLGKAGSSETPPAAQASGAAQDAGAGSDDGGAAGAATGANGQESTSPQDAGNGEPDAEVTEEPTATPTATATPSGECAFCLDGDIAAEPTPTPECAFCIDDLDIAQPVDTPPSIGEVTTSFCYPTMVLFFELEDADVVWFSFTSEGATHQSQHIDADTFPGFLSKDMGYLSWDVYFISNLRVHATDDQGNHVWSDPIEVPEPDLGC